LRRYSGGRKLPLYRQLFPELRHLGEVEGQNLVVEYFTAEGHIDRYADLARRVVERDPDVIVCLTGDLVPALIKESRTVHPKYKCQCFPQFKNVSALGSDGGRARSPSVAQRPTGARGHLRLKLHRLFLPSGR
jgi:hypothetical protein